MIGYIEFFFLHQRSIIIEQKNIRSMHELELKGEKYYFQKKVGSGYTSEVYRAVSGKGEALCVKIINAAFYGNQLGKELVNNQISILEKLDHANILKFLKKEVRERLMIVTQFCEDGNLYDYLQRKRTVGEEEALHIMRGVVSGCEYMASKGILHRDLKPENIFLKGHRVKIADFGFAVEASNSKLMNINVGSPLYMPYQSLHEKKFSLKSDIFAIGVIWYELLTGKTPFEASSEAQLKEKVRNSAFRSKQIKCSKKTQEIIFKCLSFKIDHRPTTKQLVAAIQEISTPQKQKTKSVYDDLIIKKIGNKENVCSKATALAKDMQRIKTNETKKTQISATVNKMQRCKTFVNASRQLKDPFKQYIEATVSKRTSQEKSKRATSRVQQKKDEKQDSPFLQQLQRLQKLNLPFLPQSIQAKFSNILISYRNLLSKQKEALKQCSQLDMGKDQLLSTLSTCTKQSQFCKCCLGFVRRLVRLAKSYKEWPSCLKDLTVLWERVEKRSNAD